MERTQLLSELVALDAEITATTALAARAFQEREFERLIEEVRQLRKKRSELQARLNALPQSDTPPS
jgi:hypothetical protein